MAEEKGEKKDGGKPGGDKPDKSDKPSKPEGKESSSGKRVPLSQFTGEVVGLIFIAVIVMGILNKYLLNGAFSWQAVVDAILTSVVGVYIQRIVIGYIFLANILSLIFLALLVYALVNVRRLQKKWYKMVNPDYEEIEEFEVKNERWQRILEHMQSDNPSNWRLAILEADIILDELLDANGYVGDTIGDKLKKASRGDFTTLDNAWEAHRIRNAIAHEGQDFVLTQREARRILGLYETTFREFDFI